MDRAFAWIAMGLLVACGGGSGGGNTGTGTGSGTATGGGTTNLSDGSDPVMVLVPNDVLEFGDFSLGETSQEFVTVRNDGGSPLVISNVSLEGSGAFTMLEAEVDTSFELLAGDLKYLEVVYVPVENDDAQNLAPRASPISIRKSTADSRPAMARESVALEKGEPPCRTVTAI